MSSRARSSGCSPASSTSPTTRSCRPRRCGPAELTADYNATAPTDRAGRRRILEELLGSVGEDVEIRQPFRVDYGYQIHVGPRTFANWGLVAADVGRIEIGADVQIGPNVQLLTPTHPIDPDQRRDKWEAAEPITIGDNVWLGGGVIVCPGVSIGADTVVGAGSVVTKDLPARVVAVGNPARVIRRSEALALTRGLVLCRLLGVSDLVGQTRHDEAVARLLASYRAIPAGAPVRLAKSTSNLFRSRARTQRARARRLRPRRRGRRRPGRRAPPTCRACAPTRTWSTSRSPTA